MTWGGGARTHHGSKIFRFGFFKNMFAFKNYFSLLKMPSLHYFEQ